MDLDVSADKLWWHTPYRDALGGSVIRIDRRGYRITLPARSARMWVREAAGVPPAAMKVGQSGN